MAANARHGHDGGADMAESFREVLAWRETETLSSRFPALHENAHWRRSY
jgi:hypothetical protein